MAGAWKTTQSNLPSVLSTAGNTHTPTLAPTWVLPAQKQRAVPLQQLGLTPVQQLRLAPVQGCLQVLQASWLQADKQD